MKKLIYITILIIVLASCKSAKDSHCDAYSYVQNTNEKYEN